MENLNVISQRAGKRRARVLMPVLLFVALTLVSGTQANAQVECLGACEQQYSGCLRIGGSSTCQDLFEACVNACLGRSAALMG